MVRICNPCRTGNCHFPLAPGSRTYIAPLELMIGAVNFLYIFRSFRSLSMLGGALGLLRRLSWLDLFSEEITFRWRGFTILAEPATVIFLWLPALVNMTLRWSSCK